MTPQQAPPTPTRMSEKEAQELRNLRLAEDKLTRELSELSRPYLFRNPQLLTALITSIGALITIFILAQNNYFESRKELNELRNEKAEKAEKAADKASSEAATKLEQADQLKSVAEAAKKEADRLAQEAAVTKANAVETIAATKKEVEIATRRYNADKARLQNENEQLNVQVKLRQQGWTIFDDQGSLTFKATSIPPESVPLLRTIETPFRVDLRDTQVSDVSALKELKSLTALYLDRTQVSDVSALKDLKSLSILSKTSQ